MDRISPQLGRREPDVNRASLAVVVAILHVLLGYFLIVGLGVRLPQRLQEAMTVISLRAPPPLQPEAAKPAGAAAPAAREAKPVPREAPPPVVRVVPPPVIAAPVAAMGTEASAGAAPLPGPGSGAGGEGYGTGSGGDGYGAGGGTPARWVSGRIKASDYPDDAFDDGVEGITGVRLVIGTNGRVVECAVTRSSGSDDLDDATCPLIRKRFRYDPARDAAGRPVEWEENGAQEWIIERR